MNKPQRYVVRRSLFTAVVFVVAATLFLFGPLIAWFAANIFINGLILGVLFLGIIYNFRQVLMLYPEFAWIEGFRKSGTTLSRTRPPRLLAPMATMLGERQDNLSLSTLSMRSLLDGIGSRLEESRDLSRYTIGLLIFLGLLGTFWGLLETVSSIRPVIEGLSVGDGEINTVLNQLKSDLKKPLSGMDTAFASSLFGLAGSLVLGFLDLQANQAQNRFYNELEDWLSSLTRLSSGALPGDGDQSVPAYVQALLEQTAEGLENLQRTIQRGQEGNIASNNSLIALTDKLGTLGDQMRLEQNLLIKLGENQTDIKSLLDRMTSGQAPESGAMDEATRAHIRNLDLYMARLLEEMTAGRDDAVSQLRSEIKLLARTIAASSNEGER